MVDEAPMSERLAMMDSKMILTAVTEDPVFAEQYRSYLETESRQPGTPPQMRIVPLMSDKQHMHPSFFQSEAMRQACLMVGDQAYALRPSSRDDRNLLLTGFNTPFDPYLFLASLRVQGFFAPEFTGREFYFGDVTAVTVLDRAKPEQDPQVITVVLEPWVAKELGPWLEADLEI